MKVSEIFTFDKRVIDRLQRANPSHRQKVKEYIEKTQDAAQNIEIINIRDLFPQKRQKGNK
ncbi:MAG: hypothetical protein ACP5QK_06205 [Myxococcota bacterium]